MSLNELLDEMEDLIANSWNLPLSGGKCLIPLEEIEDLLDRIRLSLPKEIKQARMIVSDRKDIISDAKKEADEIIKKAQKEAQKAIEDDEITKQAKEKADDIVANANSRAVEMRKSSGEYVDRVLNECENSLVKNLQELRNIHRKIKLLPK